MRLKEYELAILENAGLSPIADHERVGHWLAIIRLIPILRSHITNMQHPSDTLRCFAHSNECAFYAFLIDGTILGWNGLTWTSSSKL